MTSRLAAEPAVVWSHATTPAGVNRELGPVLRMTFPPGLRDLTASWQPGRRIFRSRLLLGGWLPIEYDDLVLVEVEPGRRFLERSSMLSQRVWEHERVVDPAPGGCTLTDRVRFVPRVGGIDWLCRPVFRAVFWLRHRNLRRLFAEPAARLRGEPE